MDHQLKLAEDSVKNNINSIDINTVSEVQNELGIYDVTSLVFLLYDVQSTATALERLTLLQKSHKAADIDLLKDWAISRARHDWQYEFLEAIHTCQLHSITQKMGFNVDYVKLYFSHTKIKFIHPMKKMLYRLCEHLTMDNLGKLKDKLLKSGIDVRKHGMCELILLDLMLQKFIAIDCLDINHSIERLVEMVTGLPGLESIVFELKSIGNNNAPVSSEEFETQVYELEDFSDLDKIVSNSSYNDKNSPKIKTDALSGVEIYPIYDKDNLGICYIVNQTTFTICKENNSNPLEDRKGSDNDKIQLNKIMELNNFHVIIHENLKSDEIKDNLKDVINRNVTINDSAFVYCVLSHGVEGSIYGADSKLVKIEELKDIMDNSGSSKLIGKPKILIIQACQVAPSQQPSKFVADGPPPVNLKKLDFLTYWATVPGYAAYRHEQIGSIFIQILCTKIHNLREEEHLDDIFKSVNNSVRKICLGSGIIQVPEIRNTLTKKFYLCCR